MAYLITFRCYGTWLHGDERGSVDRFHNVYKTPYAESNAKRLEYSKSLMKNAPVKLNAERRKVVESALRETCDFKNWHIYALNVRTNHIHIVVGVGEKHPDKVLIALKANATRKMRENKCWNSDKTPWAEKGSKRWLWTEKSIEKAVDYVVNRQGDPLPDSTNDQNPER